MHEARPVAHDHLRIRMSLQVEPPCRIGLGPTVHGHGDEVRTVFDVAEDHTAFAAGSPPGRGQMECAPTRAFRAPEPEPSAGQAIQAPVQTPEEAHEPAGGKIRATPARALHGPSLLRIFENWGLDEEGCLSEARIMNESEEEKAVEEVADRLAERFPSVPRYHVEQVVNDVHLALDGHPIRDFVPVLVEHDARKRLRSEGIRPTRIGDPPNAPPAPSMLRAGKADQLG